MVTQSGRVGCASLSSAVQVGRLGLRDRGRFREPRYVDATRSAHVGGRSVKGLVVVITCMVAIFATATAAMASEGAATQYKASFSAPMPDGGFSQWTCSGVHIVNRVSITDSEICTITG